MPTLVSDIITQAFLDLGVTAVGESITTAEQTDAFLRLNQIIGSLSTEGATVFTETLQTFTLSAGGSAYTLGTAGSWATSARAQRVVAWKALANGFSSGGAPLDFATFEAAVKEAFLGFTKANSAIVGIGSALIAQVAALQADAQQKIVAMAADFYQTPAFSFPAMSLPTLALASANIPMILGADTAYPSINVRIYPPPVATGAAEITYWTPVTKFAAVGDTVALPDGWERMLHWLLAMDLFPQYARAGQTAELIAGEAQNAKSSIIGQNTGDSAPKAA